MVRGFIILIALVLLVSVLMGAVTGCGGETEEDIEQQEAPPGTADSAAGAPETSAGVGPPPGG